ncbi:alpha/beta hydrolase family protein [Enterococcus sp. N249-2]
MHKITTHSLFDLKSIAQPVLVKDEIFFIETTIDETSNQYRTEIRSFHIRTNKIRHWGIQGHHHDNLQVSPNQEWLSFVSKEDGSEATTLWIMPLAGGKAQTVVSEQGLGQYFWVKDSSTIYYQKTSEKTQDSSDSTKDLKLFPKIKVTNKVDYLADGVGFLEEKSAAIYQIDLDKKTPELVFTQDHPFQFEALTNAGDYVYISSKSDPDDEWHYGSMIYQINTATQSITSMADYLPKGSYSFAGLQGEQLLLLGNDLSRGFVTLDQVFLVDVAQKTAANLSEGLDKAFGNAIISDFQQRNRGPKFYWLDEDAFIAPVTEQGKLIFYRGTTAGTWEKVVDQPLDIVDTAYESREKLIVVYSTPVVPSRLGRIDLQSGKIMPLYDPNEEVMAARRISQPEPFWFQGADKWQIQGWYLPPIESTTKHPAILYIHGGPQVCYGETFFHEMQVHAANGYGVILLNPRGGQGYGQDFVKAILGDYGNKDFEDLMLGLDAVLAQHPEIDAEKVHVIGGSYGGFMTNWIVGHTDRFASAVTQRSISNWLSFYGTSDIGPFFVKYQLLRELDEASALWNLSPLAYADQVKTPTLVLHGENDLRCPQEQGQQFYMALKRHGVDTKLMLFPQSSHGLSRNGLPNVRIERIRAISDWIDDHGTL